MKPDTGRFIAVAAGHLMTRTAPALAAGYEQSSVTALGALLIALGEESERAAARRVEENRALRRLFGQAAPALGDPDLRSRLEQAAGSEDPGFRVSDLESANGELRALLIDLHTWAESVDSPAARRIEAEIWQELVTSSERRKLLMGPF